MDTYPDLPGYREVETPIAPADTLAPKQRRLQRMAEGAIRDTGADDRSADELAARLDMDRWSIQPRASELTREGLIRVSGQAQAELRRQAGHCLDRHMIAGAMSRPLPSVRHGGAFETSPFCGFGEVSIAPLQPKTTENPSNFRNGTALAIKYSIIGVAAHLPRSTGRGGARNRADRGSHALTAAQIGNLMAAERHAGKIGLPFNRMITIHWEAAGVPLACMAQATGQFIDLLTKWLARKDRRTSWLWVHENGDDRGKGGHCHLLAHVPADLVQELTSKLRGWLRCITEQTYQARVICSRPIGRRLGLEVSNPDLHSINLEAACGYLYKGAPQAVLDAFGIIRKHKPGGRVIGKRCGTSQNIGVKARTERE